jgi:formylglycine-generating enzyme required for sulfatase activity
MVNKHDRNYAPGAFNDESPVHEVTLRRFRIGRYPVTVQQFGAFIADKGYSLPKHWAEGHGKFTEPSHWERQKQYPNRPVVGVSWFESAAYCSWAGGRLPTEAEWERAARGPESNRYPWGNHPRVGASRVSYQSSVAHPTPVGLFPKGNTLEGLCDMLGNVWEWCGNWYGAYETGPLENPTGPTYGLVRGGSCFCKSQSVRVSRRFKNDLGGRSVDVGFRCARE